MSSAPDFSLPAAPGFFYSQFLPVFTPTSPRPPPLPSPRPVHSRDLPKRSSVPAVGAAAPPSRPVLLLGVGDAARTPAPLRPRDAAPPDAPANGAARIRRSSMLSATPPQLRRRSTLRSAAPSSRISSQASRCCLLPRPFPSPPIFLTNPPRSRSARSRCVPSQVIVCLFLILYVSEFGSCLLPPWSFIKKTSFVFCFPYARIGAAAIETEYMLYG